MKYKTCTDYWFNTDTMTLRGEFEEMYRDIVDPWGCKRSADSLNNRIFLELLFGERRFKRILDVGCGLGGLTNNLSKKNGKGDVVGCDVSQSAIQKASDSYPHIKFVIRNILVDGIDDLGRFDLIVCSEIVWYILDGIEKVFRKIHNAVAEKKGIVGIHQYFPYDQKFGKNIINGIDGFEEFITKRTDFKIAKKSSVLKMTEQYF